MQERITRAAVRLNDLVYTGDSHGTCYNIVSYDNLTAYKWEEGFMTSKFRFVNRKEAAVIAYHSGQIADDPEPTGVQLTSTMLKELYKEEYEPWRSEG